MTAIEEVPPEAANVVLTRHPSGVTLNFPVSRDFIPTQGRRARDEFRLALGCGLACLALAGLGLTLGLLGLPPLAVFLAAAALMGMQFVLLALVVASFRLLAHLWNPNRNDNVARLAVTEDALVRTLRDGRGHQWPRRDIHSLRVHDEVVEWQQTEEMGAVYCRAHVLCLLVELADGKKQVLC
jgi:hypothetical protein